MANGYSQIFTLKDIFNNKKLKDKLPLVNYKEKELENGKISRRTNVKSVNRFVFDTATSAARPFYKPIKTTRSGDIMIISGEMVGDHDGAVDAVYNALQSKRVLFIWTANNVKMISYALKESEKNKNNGVAAKLYLRVQSMQQIEGMTRPQIQALLQNIMENIVYGDDFPKTQKKYGVENWNLSNQYNYKQLKLRWKSKVGA
jgi:hypothetical protein